MNGLKNLLLQLEDCMMEISCLLGGGSQALATPQQPQGREWGLKNWKINERRNLTSLCASSLTPNGRQINRSRIKRGLDAKNATP